VGNVLIVSAGERSTALIRSVLEQTDLRDIRYASCAEAARAQWGRPQLEVIVLAPPLPGSSLDVLAAEAVRATQAGVIVIVDEWEDGRTAEGIGALLMKKPVSQSAFVQAIRHARAVYRRAELLLSENKRLHVRLDEVRLISRAKLLMMKRFSMTEEQAHHYLERQAMKERISLGEAAKNIVTNCEM